jgi:hypothetical protein
VARFIVGPHRGKKQRDTIILRCVLPVSYSHSRDEHALGFGKYLLAAQNQVASKYMVRKTNICPCHFPVRHHTTQLQIIKSKK